MLTSIPTEDTISTKKGHVYFLLHTTDVVPDLPESHKYKNTVYSRITCPQITTYTSSRSGTNFEEHQALSGLRRITEGITHLKINAFSKIISQRKHICSLRLCIIDHGTSRCLAKIRTFDVLRIFETLLHSSATHWRATREHHIIFSLESQYSTSRDSRTVDSEVWMEYLWCSDTCYTRCTKMRPNCHPRFTSRHIRELKSPQNTLLTRSMTHEHRAAHSGS